MYGGTEVDRALCDDRYAYTVFSVCVFLFVFKLKLMGMGFLTGN